jgi:chorismate mutase/prephenate dehydratase
MEHDEELALIVGRLEQAEDRLASALEDRVLAVRDLAELAARAPEIGAGLPTTAEVVARVLSRHASRGIAGLASVMEEAVAQGAGLLQPMRVVVLGPEGGLGHLAAHRFFDGRGEFDVVGSAAEVFAALEHDPRGRAVVPFETSSDGALSMVFDGLSSTSAHVTGELTLPSTWTLYSATGSATDVEKVYGTASALAACERTLRDAFPRASLLDVRSSLFAADLCLDDHGAAALGTDLLQERVGGPKLRVVRARLEDEAAVRVRFLVLSHVAARPTGADRTSCLLALREEPGALYGALQPLAEHDVNLTRVESRPARGAAWRDVFYVELDGHRDDARLRAALDAVRGRVRHCKVLGSFPRPQSAR